MADINTPVVRTTHLADAADALASDLGLALPVAAGGLRYVGPPGGTAMGPAFTLQQHAVATPPDQPAPPTRHGEAASTLASPGDVLVIAIAGAPDAATWGEAQTLRAKGRGLAGVLIDGCTRDIEAVQDEGLPMMVRGISPIRSARRMQTMSVGAEVAIAGVRIRPGDLVALDADGFVCIPARHVGAVLAKARAIATAEAARDRALRQGPAA